MDTERIREIAEQALSGTDRFVVGIRQLPSDEIEVTIDSDTTVGIDDCIALSRAVTGAFDRDAEDFALTVVSAGIGQPLVCERQYRKMVGREVDVVLRDGRKLTAEAKAFDGGLCRKGSRRGKEAPPERDPRGDDSARCDQDDGGAPEFQVARL